MKKSTLSFWFVAASAAYVVYLHVTSPSEISIQASPAAQQNGAAASLPLPPVAESTPPPLPTDKNSDTKFSAVSPPPLPKPSRAPTPKPKPAGMYADGAYTGSRADAYYGTVQVEATVQNGRLTNVSFLQYPNDRRTSQLINSQAMPVLMNEAIRAQSANVDIVSGATDTSMAFQQSLGDALLRAKS